MMTKWMLDREDAVELFENRSGVDLDSADCALLDGPRRPDVFGDIWTWMVCHPGGVRVCTSSITVTKVLGIVISESTPRCRGPRGVAAEVVRLLLIASAIVIAADPWDWTAEWLRGKPAPLVVLALIAIAISALVAALALADWIVRTFILIPAGQVGDHDFDPD